MTNKSLSLTLILAVLTLGMVVSCGGDDDSHEVEAGAGGSAAGGGTGGSGGASGTSGAGGSGGTSGNNTGGAGGTSGGGAGGVGGTGGDGGDGGFGMMNQQMCPTAQPANGETCMPGRGDCEFGDNLCDCINDSDTWVCWNPATDCPAEAPVSESACPLVGIECEYGQGRDSNDCECNDDGWECDEDDEPGDEDGGV